MDELKAEKDSSELESWQIFLNSLHNTFSKYEILKYRDRYNVADILNWGSRGKISGIRLTKENIDLFLEKIEKYNLVGYESVRNTTLTEKQFIELNHVLNLTLKHTHSIQREKHSIFVKGSFVILSEVFKNNVRGNISVSEIKNINIFASNSIFFDLDLLFPGQRVSITAISPTWEIIGKRKIYLSGADGVPQWRFHKVPTSTTNKSKNGNNGKSGKPGLPGGAGGTFFGIGDKFINGVNLTITANGGKGGWGQDGGDGTSGDEGKHAVMPEDVHYHRDSTSTCGNENFCDNYFKKHDMHCQASVTNHWYGYNREGTYKFYGIRGGRGGNGGDGGKGGKGGNAGNVRVLELKGNATVLKYYSMGENGADGIGGSEGKGGIYGDDLETTCTYKEKTSMFFLNYDSKWYLQRRIYNYRQPSGKRGTDGAYTVNMMNPEPKVADIEATTVINEYKNYLRENLSDDFRKISLMNFLDQLDRSEKVVRIYSTVGLIKDFKYLEMQLPKLGKNVNVLPFYESLLTKINTYARIKQGISLEYKKALNYLYAATLSKIFMLKEDLESTLIVDIEGYLGLVRKNIEDLKDLQNEKYKREIIERYNESYNDNIHKNIEEATLFIEKQIKPELELILNQVDNNIDLLIDQTIDLQEKAKEEQKELITLKQNLSKALESRGILSLLENIGQIVNLLGPTGSIAGSLMTHTSSISESLSIEDRGSKIEFVELPEAMKEQFPKLKDKVSEIANKKTLSLIKLLDKMIQEMSNFPDALSDILIKVTDLRNKLVENRELSNEVLTSLVEELELKLKQKLDILQLREKQNEIGVNSLFRTKRKVTENSENISMNNGNTTLINLLIKQGKALQIFEIGVDIYNKYKDYPGKLDLLVDAIEESKVKQLKLKQYETYVYDTTIPMLKRMKNYLNEVASKLGTKSKISLNVVQWQVQDSLRDLKIQMQRLTKGIQYLEDDLPRCVEKLEEVMTIFIDVFKNLRSYEEQQNLSSYIALVNSVMANNINISNKELRKEIHELDLAIKSNLVLKQYEIAKNAFKQFVYPLAYDYLRDIPPQIEFEQNIDDLVFKATSKIDSMVSKVALYKTSIRKYNKFIRTGPFRSNFISTEPFYVWKNENHKEMISKLLSGQQIVMKADVLDSQAHKDAIKFSYIDLTFISKNETLQRQINETLKAFEVRAIHMGNSYYRYNDKVYVIGSESQTIDFYLEKDSSGDPIDTNDVYKMIKNGDFLLSPYAWWKFQLFNTTKRISFHNLSIFENQVDLALEGVGKYVNTRLLSLDLKVDEYYRAIGSDDPMKKIKYNESSFSSTNPVGETHDVKSNQGSTAERTNNYRNIGRGERYKRDNNYNQKSIAGSTNDKDALSSWFSWLRLPNFKILPGAEASTLGDFKERATIASSYMDIFEGRYTMIMKQFNGESGTKNKVIQPDNICFDDESTKSTSNFVETFLETLIPLLRNKINLLNNKIFTYNAFSFNKNFNNGSLPRKLVNHQNADSKPFSNIEKLRLDDQTGESYWSRNYSKMDLIGNLLLGKLVANKIFSENKLNYDCCYMSPEQERNIEIDKLTVGILPVIMSCDDDRFTDDNKIQPLWYQDLKINIRGDMNQNKNNKTVYENMSTELLADLGSLFNDN